jgi:chromosome partitioning protein
MLGKTMKIISIISQKGGAGKTTLAVHLAVAAEKKGLRTIVFDLDPQASATTWADKRENPSPMIIPVQVPRLESFMNEAKKQGADLIIIDSAPHADSASLEASKVADLILIPCRPSAFDLQAIRATLSLAAIAAKPAYVVLNAIPPQGKVGEEAKQVLEKVGVQIVPYALHNLIAFSHCLNDGRTAQEFDPKGKASQEIYQLFQWVKNHTTIQSGNNTTQQHKIHTTQEV